jgi:hypothetical protein
VVGRINFETLFDLSQYKLDRDVSIIAAFERVLGIISTHFRNRDVGFTGILLAGWESFFSLPVLNELNKHLFQLGLDVYLQTGPPHFLQGADTVPLASIAGLVIQNGLILPHGERRDCFDMDALRPTIKAFVSQECLGSFTTLMWEPLDDGVVVEHAVVKRAFAWCRFHGAIPWIAPSRALFNSQPGVQQIEPLSAFDWLKDANTMQVHELWRNSASVRTPSFFLRFFLCSATIANAELVRFQVQVEDVRS